LENRFFEEWLSQAARLNDMVGQEACGYGKENNHEL
jgi:hypothetical protein